MPPARRRPPSPRSRTTPASRAPHPQDRRPFCLTPTMITSPHNEQAQGGPPAPAPPRAALRGRGRGPAGGRRRGGLAGGLRAARRRRRRGRAARRRLGPGLGHPRAGRLRAALGAPCSGPLCVALWGVRDPGNVGDGAAQRAGLRRRARSRSAPTPPTRSAPRRCARRWARSSQMPVARVASVAQLPGAARRAGRRRGRAAARARCEGTLVVGAERAGLPRRGRRGLRRPWRTSRSRGDSLNAAMAATIALYESTRVPAR